MIPRVTGAEFTQGRYFSRHLPAVITDGLHDWSGAGKWSPDCLLEKMQDRRVKVCVSESGHFNWKPTRDFTSATEFKHEEMSLQSAAEFMQSAPPGRHIYLMQQSIPKQFPELMTGITTPQWIAGERNVEPHLWFGRDSISQLHFDGVNNFFAQLHGEKHLTLFAPADTRYLYPFPLDAAMTHFSAVDSHCPDLDRHPKFQNAKPLHFTLSAGELLFLPAYWWHGVQAIGVAISISFWWPTSNLTQYLTAPNALRALYGAYARDRLAGVKRLLLTPNGLGFLAVAKLLVTQGEAWGAAMFALAGFDEYIGKLCCAKGVEHRKVCPIADLPDELAAVRQQLAPTGELETCFELARQLALQVGLADDWSVDGNDVDALTKMALRLEQRGC